MAFQQFGQQLLAQIHFRLGIVAGVPLVLDHFEAQVIEGAPHLVKLVLGFDDDFVEPLLDRPELLLLGKGAEMTLASPVSSGAANPCLENPPSWKLHMLVQTVDEIRQFGILLVHRDLVRDLE